MIHHALSQYLNQKSIIIGLAAVASVISCIFFLMSTHTDMKLELEDLEQQLFINQKNLRKGKVLQQQVKQQTQQLARLDRSLLKAKDQDSIISAMQIQVQSMLTSAELEPESLRPIASREVVGQSIQSVVLKLRLSGTIEQLKNFLTLLYKADSFFHVETLTIKPFKKDQLKIYMDLRSYYQTSTPTPLKEGGGE